MPQRVSPRKLLPSPRSMRPSSVPEVPADSEGEATIGHWKRQVVEKCLFGVDMNGLAVELAKLALWLETVAADQPHSFLDHHLRHGNSLVGANIDKLAVLPGFPLLSNAFREQLQARLPALLQHGWSTPGIDRRLSGVQR